MWSLLSIALRNVLRNRRRTMITLAALLLGVGVMVGIRGVLNGLQRALVQTAVSGQTGAIQVHHAGYLKNVIASPLTLDMPADEDFLNKIRKVPHVTAVAPRILFAGMINVGDQTLFAAMQAIDPKREFDAVPLRKMTVSDGGRFTSGKIADAVLLTAELEKGLRGTPGQAQLPAAVLGPDKDGALSGENITIAGQLKLNLPGEKKLAVVPLALAQRLLKMEGRATELVIAVDNIDHIPEVAASLRRVLGSDYEVHTWDQVASFVKQAMERQNLILSLVATVFMILMLLGVANTVLMSVLERTREIGTMMAVGVRRGKILALFLIEAATIGLLGGVAGGLAGLGVVTWLEQRGIEVTMPGSAVPFIIRPYTTLTYLAFVVSLAAGGSLLFAVYPSWRASRMRPVQALAGG